MPVHAKYWASLGFMAYVAATFLAFVGWRIEQDERAARTRRAESCAGLGLAGNERDQCAASPEDLTRAQQRSRDEAARDAFPTTVREITKVLYPFLAPHNSGHLLTGGQGYVRVDIDSWCRSEAIEAVLGPRADMVGRRVTFDAALFVSSVWLDDERVGYEVTIAPIIPGGMDHSCPASIQRLPPAQRLALRDALCEPCGVRVWGTLQLLEASYWNQDEFRLGVDIEGLDVWPPS